MSILNIIKDTLIAIISKHIAFGCIVKRSTIEHKTYISSGTRFYYGSLKANSYIGRDGYFFKTCIGKFTSIGDMCYCGMPEHEMYHVSTSPAFYAGKNRMNAHYANLAHPEYKETKIGNDVWIGTCVLIKAGISIGDGAIIGMGSVVTHDIPPYSIAAGVPARVIRQRFSDDISIKLVKIAWWNWSDNKIMKHSDEFNNVVKFTHKHSPATEEDREL